MTIAPFPYDRQPDGLRLSDSLGLTPDHESELREILWGHICHTGEIEPEELAEWVLDDLSWEPEEGTLHRAWDELVAARRAQIRSWPEEIRVTPLTRAFTELADIGVVAREDFSCCGTCASYEIGGERDDSRTWRGYITFHHQDAERIPDIRETYVGYGVFADAYYPKDEWDALGKTGQEDTYLRLVTDLMRNEVFPVLERHGIEVEWDGKHKKRILLKNVDWYPVV